MELERAEQRTVHYEEIRVRIGLMEKQLANIVARGDSVKEIISFFFLSLFERPKKEEI